MRLNGLVSRLPLGVLLVAGLAACDREQPSPMDPTIQEAVYVDGGGTTSFTLYAGQSIDAGEVQATVVGGDLVVTYVTTDGWELTEAHLWVGEHLADMPQARNGNPKIGNFPHNSGDITGMTSFSFSIPLSSLGGEPYVCDRSFYLAAHAALRKDNGGGGYQTETGWGDGKRIVERGSWATYFAITLTCDNEPPEPKDCETAFAFGDQTLIDVLAAQGVNTNRWGWQITVNTGENLSTPIYAGAGQNDISKGTYVGDLSYSYDGTLLNVSFDMAAGFTMDETHLYAGNSDTDTAAPGQYGNLNEDLGDATSDSYSLTILDDGDGKIYIVAHAVVCGAF
ncbi:MAG: hypothetical protein JSW46_04810 [Gemmatimonadota bacterium]|nr:MAG: hypothetical protein JSW46_04810 [Gemmatimonadota bacterium]